MARRITLIAFVLISLLAFSFATAQAEHRGPDSVITANVEQALQKAFDNNVEGMTGYRITVKTDKGVVTLTGKARSAAEQQKALNTAKAVKGVKSVVDQIDVATGK